MRRRGAIGAAAAMAVLLATPAPAAAFVKTHGMMLDSVATIVAAELLPAGSIPRGRPIVLVTPVRGDTLDILAQRLLERLRGAAADVRIRERSSLGEAMAGPGGVGVAPAGDSVQASGTSPLELHARVDGASVAFVRRIRSFPFGVKGYERLVSMRASAALQDPGSGQVVWAKSATASAADVVPSRDLAYVAGGSAGINPALPQGSGFRLLEPLIVLGVVAGLVVLFYSNRN